MSAKIIVIGNEKGGVGKTTTCMHLITSLLHMNKNVASIDLDIYQLSLTTYCKNRINFSPAYKMWEHFNVRKSEHNSLDEIYNEQIAELLDIIKKTKDMVDFLVIDTPAGENRLSQVAHSYADIIITPINDSFIDLDLILKSDIDNSYNPGVYSTMVWKQKLLKAKNEQKTIDWILIKNRSSFAASKNRQQVDHLLAIAAKKFGFRITNGFAERSIFRELFARGLTLVDLMNNSGPIITEQIFKPSPSHIAARQELREFLNALNVE